MNQERYPSLFSPIKIGGTTLKNRVILTAMGGTGLFGFDGHFNPKIREYYLERAKGGAGLMAMGGPLDSAKRISEMPSSIQNKFQDLPNKAQNALLRSQAHK